MRTTESAKEHTMSTIYIVSTCMDHDGKNIFLITNDPIVAFSEALTKVAELEKEDFCSEDFIMVQQSYTDVKDPQGQTTIFRIKHKELGYKDEEQLKSDEEKAFDWAVLLAERVAECSYEENLKANEVPQCINKNCAERKRFPDLDENKKRLNDAIKTTRACGGY